MHPKRLLILTLALMSCVLPPAAQARRALTPEDWFRFQEVSHLHIAPDGSAVVYLVTSFDRSSDQSRSALWLADWAGTRNVQLADGENLSEPRFSPDGRSVSFLSARSPQQGTQLWVVGRQGGEARPLSHVAGEIVDYAWSPDNRHVVLVLRAAPASTAARPLVIDAYQFKAEGDGYLTAERRSHLCLLDLHGGDCAVLTAEPTRTDSLPAVSPDGRQIAYISNDAVDRSGAGVDEIEIIEAQRGAKPRRLLSVSTPNYQRLAWSPDGKRLAFLEGDEPKYAAYSGDRLAVIELATAKVRDLTGRLDRAAFSPYFSADGRSIQFAVEDDAQQYLAQVDLRSGAIERRAGTEGVESLAAAAGHTALLLSGDQAPVEVYALEGAKLRALSAHNRALFAELSLGSVEDIAFRSADGTEVHGEIVKPPDFVPGRRYPTIFWLHGGPDLPDYHSLKLRGYGPPLERQLFASHGYVAVAVNYRGGTGRGAQFARSIFADWGHKEVEDVLAGVDYAIAVGLADPARLGVGGWSYGAMLTDYLIASDTRFKAAISGAGSGNQLANYGSDEYIVQYDTELGPPWRNVPLWMKVSYPFLHADRIHTPTLFLTGDGDFNTAVGGSEQMYQALRTLGVPTQLIVYPGEDHVLARPSFLVDRWQRYLSWMDRYLAGGN